MWYSSGNTYISTLRPRSLIVANNCIIGMYSTSASCISSGVTMLREFQDGEYSRKNGFSGVRRGSVWDPRGFSRRLRDVCFDVGMASVLQKRVVPSKERP